MILQQYYTRERRGIFRTTDGYDTIAKTPSLENNLIKKSLHPYCFYDAPRELQIAGEKDADKYPEALTFLQLDTKQAVLGQSVYVPVDFTGQRSTFFTHNYVIAEASKEDFIRNPEKILYVDSFIKSYDIEQGANLEELTNLSYTKNVYDKNFVDTLLSQLNITGEIFKNLLYAITVSATSRKKIYIALDVDSGDISKYSKKLLLCILESLPYEIRRAIGFVSYIQRPESKKNINIMFVDKESIRHGISGADKDFIFDFSTNKFTNIEPSDNPYLDFVWDNRGNQSSNNSFYEFIDNVLNQKKLQKQADIEVFSQLAILYQVMKGNTEIYEIYKDIIFEYILTYLDGENMDMQVDLSNLAMRLIEEELKMVSSTSSYVTVSFAKSIIPYYNITRDEYKDKISKVFLYSLLVSKRLNDKEYIREIFEIILANNDLNRQVMGFILENKPIKEELLNEYLNFRIVGIQNVNRWVQEVEDLRDISEQILDDSYFQLESTKKLLSIVKRQNNIVHSGGRVYGLLNKLFNGTMEGYKANIEKHLDNIILDSISISNITKEELQSFKVSQFNNSGKAITLYVLKDFMMMQNANEELKNILNNSTQLEKQEIQEAIKNLAINLTGVHFYEGVILAFYKGGANLSYQYNYGQILNFIYTNKGKEIVYKFIEWSITRDEFTLAKKNRLHPEYVTALKRYFVKVDPDAFKDSSIKQSFYNIKKPKIRKVFVDINYELASGIEKFFLKHGWTVLKVSSFIILLLGVGFGTIKITESVMEKVAYKKEIEQEQLNQAEAEEQRKKEEKEKLKLILEIYRKYDIMNDKIVGYEPPQFNPNNK